MPALSNFGDYQIWDGGRLCCLHQKRSPGCTGDVVRLVGEGGFASLYIGFALALRDLLAIRSTLLRSCFVGFLYEVKCCGGEVKTSGTLTRFAFALSENWHVNPVRFCSI